MDRHSNDSRSQAGRMNSRHLPAGQGMQVAGGPNGMSPADMPTGPSQGGGGGGRGGRGPRHYHHHHHYQPHQPMHHYANYAPPYPAAQYYPPMPPHHQYQNGAMQSPAYMPYQTPYGRSPPAMQQYVPMVGVSVQQNYSSRPSQQQSPVLATPYQPPPALAPVPPQTPSSTHSSQAPPAAATPPVAPTEATKPRSPVPQTEAAPKVPSRPPFRAPVSLIVLIPCWPLENFTVGWAELIRSRTIAALAKQPG